MRETISDVLCYTCTVKHYCTILSLACYNSGQKSESIWSLIVLTRDNLALDSVAQHQGNWTAYT